MQGREKIRNEPHHKSDCLVDSFIREQVIFAMPLRQRPGLHNRVVVFGCERRAPLLELADFIVTFKPDDGFLH